MRCHSLPRLYKEVFSIIILITAKMFYFSIFCLKSFFWETSNIYSLILLTQLICIVLHMTCSVFQMDMAIKHPDLNFYMVLMALLVSGANLYFYCYYGNRSTDDYAQMANILFESNWNELPVEYQKFVKMMIANAQRPFFYHGLHIFHLNLETYLKVN